MSKHIFDETAFMSILIILGGLGGLIFFIITGITENKIFMLIAIIFLLIAGISILIYNVLKKNKMTRVINRKD